MDSLCIYIQDAANEIVAALQGKPDLIIGNYSDGNLVASLVANKFGIIQVFSPWPQCLVMIDDTFLPDILIEQFMKQH